MIWRTLVVVFMISGVLCETSMEDHQSEINETIRDACLRNGAKNRVGLAQIETQEFIRRVTHLLNAEEIKKEIEEAKPNGALDEVFKKYCAKTDQLKSYIRSLMNAIDVCVDPGIRHHLITAYNATSSLLDFICYKDGDRIALFIAEGGPECFTEKRIEIQKCGQKLRSGVPSMEVAKNLTLAEQCDKFDELASCVVLALEACSTPTPGNMAESMLRYVRQRSPCDTV